MSVALLVLRLIVGALFAGHGGQKLFGWFKGHGLNGTGSFFESVGLTPGGICLGLTPEDRSDPCESFSRSDHGRGRNSTMKRRRHTPEQVIRKLREAERLLGEGKTIPEAAKELGISEQTYHRWRNQYGGMKADDAKRLKELERENRQLKAIVADQALENRALKEIAKGYW
jgi:putative transposase